MYNNVYLPYLSYSKIDNFAERFLKTHHSSDTIPIPIEEIIEFQMGIDIIPIHGLHQAFDTDGFISSDLKSISIDLFVYESRPGRYRFTLAHEIGHLVLHSKLYKDIYFDKVEEWKKFIRSFPEKEYRWFEWQAYAFAGLILVPTKHLSKRFKHSVKQIQGLGISIEENKDVAFDTIIDLLAKEFVCSKEVIQRRLIKEGLMGDEKSNKKDWLPELDARRTSEPQEIHLLVKLTIHHYKHGFIYLGNRN